MAEDNKQSPFITSVSLTVLQTSTQTFRNSKYMTIFVSQYTVAIYCIFFRWATLFACSKSLECENFSSAKKHILVKKAIFLSLFNEFSSTNGGYKYQELTDSEVSFPLAHQVRIHFVWEKLSAPKISEDLVWLNCLQTQKAYILNAPHSRVSSALLTERQLAYLS